MKALGEAARALAAIRGSLGARQTAIGVPQLHHALHLMRQEKGEIPLDRVMADLAWHGAATAALVLSIADGLNVPVRASVTAGMAAALHAMGPLHPSAAIPLHQALRSLADDGVGVCGAMASIHDPQHPLYALAQGACLALEASAPSPGLMLPWSEAQARIAAVARREVVQLLGHAFPAGLR